LSELSTCVHNGSGAMMQVQQVRVNISTLPTSRTLQ